MKRITDIICICLLAFVLCCRWIAPVADFYATHCYPAIATALSFAAAAVPFSLEEITVLGFAAALITISVRAAKRKRGFAAWLRKAALTVAWLAVWFYMGWGNNYFRTPLYDRLGIQSASFDEDSFRTFLDTFTEELNSTAGEYPPCDKKLIEEEIKTFYAQKAVACGYAAPRSWQHVKKPLLNPLYSAVGVMGFMGPFFCEAQLNGDLSDNEYPSVTAHEMAHLAGVTGEAEASWWAYAFCRQSDDPAVRYSGYLALLPYVISHAKTLLPEAEYEAWLTRISPTAMAAYRSDRERWQEKRVAWIDSLQRSLMDSFLKTNRVSEGAQDYRGVIAVIMTMDAAEKTGE